MCKKKTLFLNLPVKYSGFPFKHGPGWAIPEFLSHSVPRIMWPWHAAVQKASPGSLNDNSWAKAVDFSILYVNRD